MAEPGPIAELLGKLAYDFSQIQSMLLTEIHLLASALFPIYVGAHASLSRPSSAAKPTKRPKKTTFVEDAEESSEEEEEELQRMEGLSPSDAIIFPLVAGTTLAGLYFLIEWLENTELLNRILNAYFSLFGVFSTGKLVSDSLDVVHSVLFPRRYVDKGTVWHVHGRERSAVPVFGPGASCDTKGKKLNERSSPLPGLASRLPLPQKFEDILWTMRNGPKQKWTVKGHAHRLGGFKARIGIFAVIGMTTGLLCVLYYNFFDKPWFLTNLMGFAFAYGALQLMSPTTFGTGSLILAALFFYDIYFVFYTPMMITVAKSLDIPIKLVFPRPGPSTADPAKKHYSMLGLGDVVLPGIVMGLALRFDLYMFYLKKQRTKPIPPGAQADPEATRVLDGQTEIVKAAYTPTSGHWGDLLWAGSVLASKKLALLPNDLLHLMDATFPKPYFHASLVGYVLGMLATLTVMMIYNHGQPALLYLVPGVLGSIWITAFFRGEVKHMWEFSEGETEEEQQDGEKEKNKEDKEKRRSESFFSLAKQDRNAKRMGMMMGKHVTKDDESNDEGKKVDELGGAPENSGPRSCSTRSRELVSFSITAPLQLSKSNKLGTKKTAVDEKIDEASGELAVVHVGDAKRRRVD